MCQCRTRVDQYVLLSVFVYFHSSCSHVTELGGL
jgi:hypothetical protein